MVSRNLGWLVGWLASFSRGRRLQHSAFLSKPRRWDIMKGIRMLWTRVACNQLAPVVVGRACNQVQQLVNRSDQLSAKALIAPPITYRQEEARERERSSYWLLTRSKRRSTNSYLSFVSHLLKEASQRLCYQLDTSSWLWNKCCNEDWLQSRSIR